jgi:hypothetical protein
LAPVPFDAGPVLMHADDGGVYHLNSSVMGSGERVDDALPNASPPLTNEAVVAGGVRTKHLGQITPRCSRAQDPEDAIEDTTVVNPRNATRLVRQHGLDGNPFIIGEFVAHDSSLQFGEFESQGSGKMQRSWRRRFKQMVSLEERLAEEATRLREKAKSLRPGIAREQAFRKARQEPARTLAKWLRSPGLQPPK